MQNSGCYDNQKENYKNSSRADNSENKKARVMDLVLVHAGDDEGQVFQV